MSKETNDMTIIMIETKYGVPYWSVFYSGLFLFIYHFDHRVLHIPTDEKCGIQKKEIKRSQECGQVLVADISDWLIHSCSHIWTRKINFLSEQASEVPPRHIHPKYVCLLTLACIL